LGPIEFGGHDEVFIGRDFNKSRNYSEEIAAVIDGEIRDLIEIAYKKAESILNGNMNKLNKIANALLDRETLNAEEFEAVFSEE
ncbi:MAG: ATP-dependent metallopeptidase FtsH/Yme1/Tma family protein, partial [Clostridiales bacterium]|nr:ATP-dependent metallopeptidase FtsH/Yme1/Tma family protein [Clostridiales bacterium]